MIKAIFLDKDGTVINDLPYNVRPELITLAAEITNGLKKLQDAGYKLFIISNQSGVAFGYFPAAALGPVKKCIARLLDSYDIKISGFYFCPHHIDAMLPEYHIDCSCRKPKPGLLLLAADVHHIDLKKSWFIGDILNDVEAGNRAGCRTVLIDNGNETEWFAGGNRKPDIISKTINDAAEMILNEAYA